MGKNFTDHATLIMRMHSLLAPTTDSLAAWARSGNNLLIITVKKLSTEVKRFGGPRHWHFLGSLSLVTHTAVTHQPSSCKGEDFVGRRQDGGFAGLEVPEGAPRDL